MVSLERFSTKRLRADRLEERDLNVLCSMNRNPEVMKTLGGLRSDDETQGHLLSNLEHWARYGFGLWILREAVDGQFVGRCAIRHVNVGGNDEIEVGYALMPEYWGRGLATEVAREMVRLAFVRLQLDDLVAFTLVDNAASRRVIEKTGGVFERNLVHAGLPHVLYRFRVSPRAFSGNNASPIGGARG